MLDTGHSRLSSPLVTVRMYNWNCFGRRQHRWGHGKLGDILVGESAEATISPKLNPGLNSNLPDANIGPQMLCPPPLLARLLLTSW